MSRPGASSRFLIEEAFAPSTRARYKDAIQKFLAWVDNNEEDATSTDQLDELMTDYFHYLYEHNGSKSQATNTLFGLIMLMPTVRDHLPTTRLALRGWNRRHPPVSYPPLTWELAVAIAVQMARHGALAQAVATVLAFDCYLRINEYCQLRAEDVSSSQDARLGREYTGVALRLRSTKTGPNQWVQVEHQAVRTLLLRLKSAARSPTQLLFGCTAAQYRRLFKSTCAELGLSADYVPHSLRHGGATRDHLRGRSLEDILMRGRWASTKSARRYVQAGRALLLATRVPEHLVALGSELSGDLLLSFSLAQTH